MAKVGLGYSSLKRTTGTNVTQLEAGVSAAFGATTVGAVYETIKNAGTVKTTGFYSRRTVQLEQAYKRERRLTLQWKTAGALQLTHSAFWLVTQLLNPTLALS